MNTTIIDKAAAIAIILAVYAALIALWAPQLDGTVAGRATVPGVVSGDVNAPQPPPAVRACNASVRGRAAPVALPPAEGPQGIRL